MDLSLSPDQESLKNAARALLELECPLLRVRELDESEDGFDRTLWTRLVELGWTGILVPSRYGGRGATFTDMGILCEELGRALAPVPFFSTAVVAPLVLTAAGTAEQQERLLPDVVRGEALFAFAYTEPEYGWEPRFVQMEANEDGNGFLLTGAKLFVHDAHLADHFIVVARTPDGRAGTTSLTLFLVDADWSGIAVSTLSGWYGTKSSEVRFQSVHVPKSNVLGEVGAAEELLAGVFDRAAILLSAYQVGGAQRAYELGLEYAQTRVQFGQAIGKFQRIQDHVIDALNAVDAARWTTYEALAQLDGGDPIDMAASIAKATASDAYHTACFHSHEIHAAIGTSKDRGLYLYTKSSRTLLPYLGDPMYHRLRVARLLSQQVDAA